MAFSPTALIQTYGVVQFLGYIIFHYTIFWYTNDGSGASGQAEIFGNDFIVTIGGQDPNFLLLIGGKEEADTATLMHELGHNLGLRHGGNVDWNCKPNYLSIMNYSYQFTNLAFNRPLNYSHGTLNPLDELQLDEFAGLGGDPQREIIYAVNGKTKQGETAGGPVDWDGDGVSSSPASGNINAISIINDCTNGVGVDLLDYDDWENLQLKFIGSIWFASGLGHGDLPTEITTGEIQAVTESVDFDGDGYSDADELRAGSDRTDPTSIPDVGGGGSTITSVTIDIKPGNTDNPANVNVNPDKDKDVAVAILSTNDFDASTVDASSVRFGKLGTEASAFEYKLKDKNGDGRKDLVLKFRMGTTAIQCGDTEAKLSGLTVGSQPIAGTGAIFTKGCKLNKPKK